MGGPGQSGEGPLSRRLRCAGHILLWLDELEAEGCIEQYDVEEVEYPRVRRWHKHQHIDHPAPSCLPASPNARPLDSRIRETSRKRRRRPRKLASDQWVGERSCTVREYIEEKVDDAAAVAVTQDGLLRDLHRIQHNAEADDSHPSAIRAVELRAKIGLVVAKDRPPPNGSGRY